MITKGWDRAYRAGQDDAQAEIDRLRAQRDDLRWHLDAILGIREELRLAADQPAGRVLYVNRLYREARAAIAAAEVEK